MSGTVRQHRGPRPQHRPPMTGAEILRLRRSLGLTHDDLAERIGVAAKTLREWERDLRVASVRASERLRAIAAKPVAPRAPSDTGDSAPAGWAAGAL